MVVCFVPHCNHYAERKTCKYFRFPKDEKQRKRWMKLIRRADRNPNENSRICSCHFRDGVKEFGPSIFPWNKTKLFDIPFSTDRKTIKVIDNPPVKFIEAPDSVYREQTVQIVEEPGLFFIEEAELVCDKSTQTINSVLAECEITLLKSEIASLKAENSRLMKQPFGFASIKHNDSVIKYYTGVNEKAFNVICEMVSRTELKYFYGWKPVNMNLPDQILMTLMKLKLNLDYIDLEVRFNVGKHSVGNIILTFIQVLREVLFDKENIPHEQEIVSNLPHSLTNYQDCGMIVDCAEFCCEAPNYRDEQEETSSSHEHGNILRGIVGIAPNGSVTYASKLCLGSSDKNIARSCNVVDIFKSGDFILTDKGFHLQGNLPTNVSPNIPPTSSQPEVTSSEIGENKKRKRSRIHLERVIRRLRLIRILHSIPKPFHKYSSTIFQLCVALANYENIICEVSDSLNLNSTDNSVVENDVPRNNE